jgi:hypothetical protein
MVDRMLKFFGSTKVTVVCLGLAVLLVFVGTIAQADQGLYQAQARYFKSFFVYWSPAGMRLKVPVFPGGYLLGGVLLLSLLVGLARRSAFTKERIGLLLVHGGLVLLLIGQLLTDLLSVESAMRLTPGETRDYSEDFRRNELVVIDTSPSGRDKVVAIPESFLGKTTEIRVPDLPFVLRVKSYWPNAELLNQPMTNAVKATATQGIGTGVWVRPRPLLTDLESRNSPGAVVEVVARQGSLGSWLVSAQLEAAQSFTCDQKTYRLALRGKRHYLPFSLTLLEARHDVYRGSDIPKNYSSRVRLSRPDTREEREVLIYMNNPLRYGGETFYQYQMGSEPGSESSTLQVVRNPSWVTPYLACVLVTLGLAVQFLTHLTDFTKRRTA